MDIGCSGMTWEAGGVHLLGRTVDRAGESSEHYITAVGRGVKCARRLTDEQNFASGCLAYTGLTIDVTKILPGSEKIWVDGVNERGLMIALLNFPLNHDNDNTAASQKCGEVHYGRMIPHILSRCETVEMAASVMERMTADDSGIKMRAHFLLYDRCGESAVAEPRGDGCGFKIYSHSEGVLTNATEYARQTENLKKFREGSVYFRDELSSEGRFVRLSQVKKRLAGAENEADAVSRMLEGLCVVTVPDGADERAQYRTMFRTVMSAESRTYYLTSAEDHRVKAVRVEDLHDNEVKEWRVDSGEDILWLG